MPPDINQSHYRFTVPRDNTILYGLGAIKGVGAAAIDNVLASRNEYGVFRDLFDVCQRVDTRKVNRRVLEALIRAGALDSIGSHRASIMASVEIALKAALQQLAAHDHGQADLFGNSALSLANVAPWSDHERLSSEKATLGFYLTGHPIAHYETEINQFVTARIADLRPSAGKAVVVAGFIVALRTLMTKSGNRMAIITMEDRSGRIELAVFPELYTEARHLLVEDQLVVVEGEVSTDDYTGGYRMGARKIMNTETARAKYVSKLLLKLSDEEQVKSLLPRLAEILKNFQGGKCPVYIGYQCNGASAELLLGKEWQVRPDDLLLDKLTEIVGKEQLFLYF